MRRLLGKILATQIFRQPVFIVGGSRSGTSILLQALGKHPHILSTPGEAPLLTSMGGLVCLLENGNPITRKYYNESLRFEKIYLYEILRRLSFEIACGPNWGVTFLIKNIMVNPLRFFLKRRWAAKTFPNEKVTDGLLHIFPKAKLIHIIRNGLEVVGSSMKFRGFRGQSFEENCNRWRNTIYSMRYLQNLEIALTVRHEELVSEPQFFFNKIFRFLNEPENENVSAFVSSTVVHPLDQPTQDGIKAKQVFQCRRPAYQEWSIEQRRTFIDVCADAMVEAGYEIPF